MSKQDFHFRGNRDPAEGINSAKSPQKLKCLKEYKVCTKKNYPINTEDKYNDTNDTIINIVK